jgi:hypothetical protein
VRSSWRISLFVIVVLVLLVVFGSHGGSSGPPIATNCRTPGMTLSAESARAGTSMQWAVTGPPGMTFVIEIGARALTPAGSPNTFRAVPDAGFAGSVEQATRILDLPKSCREHGLFSVSEAGGRTYAVRLFRITGNGTQVRAAPVVTKQLLVTG